MPTQEEYTARADAMQAKAAIEMTGAETSNANICSAPHQAHVNRAILRMLVALFWQLKANAFPRPPQK